MKDRVEQLSLNRYAAVSCHKINIQTLRVGKTLKQISKDFARVLRYCLDDRVQNI